MKKMLFAMAAMLLVATFNVKAQTEAEQKAWMDYMTPGDVHKMMAKWDGAWTGDVSLWMAPNTAPEKAQGTMDNKMILGGRYQQSEFKGTMMGMPFEGLSTLAWDNGRKIFVNTWVDNMGTGMIVMEGTWNAGTKTISFKGKQTDPMTGKVIDARQTLQIIDDNNQVMQMFGPGPDGKEFKMMEVKYTRKK